MDISDPIRSAMSLRYRDLIAETITEQTRMENFCRIFPARQSKLYDKFFSGNKYLNKILYKVLYTSEIIPYERAGDKSAHPIPAKAASLMTQNSVGSQMAGGVSQDRLHSSSGARPIRPSKSNQKLLL